MSFYEWCGAALLTVLAWMIIHAYQVRTIPRKEYLRVILEEQRFFKREWVNEIWIRYSISDQLKRKISVGKNSFNLQQLLDEGLLEYKPDTTWFSGEVEVPVATFRLTDKGLRELRGPSP